MSRSKYDRLCGVKKHKNSNRRNANGDAIASPAALKEFNQAFSAWCKRRGIREPNYSLDFRNPKLQQEPKT